MGFEKSPSNYLGGKFVRWTVNIKQPDGSGPNNWSSYGSKFTVLNGVFYGHLYLKFLSTSDLGTTGSHWELGLPFQPVGDGNPQLLGAGVILRTGTADARHSARLQIINYNSLPTIAPLIPILPYYNAATMDYTPDPNYYYEDFMYTTQARVEATKTAWQAIATDFGREAQSALDITARLRYVIKY